MPTPDEPQKSEVDSQSDSPESSRPAAGEEDVSAKDERSPRDLGSLAIGGTIGGILAAKALRGAMGAGGKSIAPAAAGYLAKRLRESRASKLPTSEPEIQSADPEEEPTSTLPQETLPEIEPEVESEPKSEILPSAIPLAEVPPAKEPASTSIPPEPSTTASKSTTPPAEELIDEEDEVLEASPENEAPADPSIGKSRDLGVEALEAEGELEEALMLVGEGGLGPTNSEDGDEIGARGSGADEDNASEKEELSKPKPNPPTTSGVRSPFMRDHSAKPPASREIASDKDSGGGRPSSSSPAEHALAGSGKQKKEAAKPTLPPPESKIPASPSTSIPRPPSAGLAAALPGVPTGLEGGTTLDPIQPLEDGSILDGGTPLVPVQPPANKAEKTALPPAAPSVPVAPSTPSQANTSSSLPASLPGLTQPSELPKPGSHLSQVKKDEAPTLPSPPETSPQSPVTSSFVPVPAKAPEKTDNDKALPSLDSEPESAEKSKSAEPKESSGLTKVPLQKSPEVQPLPQVPIQKDVPAPPPAPTPPPAAPLRDMELAARPELTKAERAAKARADKIAKKKEAKSKVKEKTAKPAKAKKDKKPKPVKSKSKSEPRKSKLAPTKKSKPAAKAKAKTGAKGRLLLVGLPILLVLGGAGGFAYMNKDKFGFGSAPAETPTATTALPSDGGGVTVTPEKPAILKEIFETPGHVIPGASNPVGVRTTDASLIEEPPPPLQFTDEEYKEIIRDPRKTLEAFLLAGTVDDLMKFVAAPELISEEIQVYYKGGKRTPIAGDIRFDKSGLVPETNLAAYQYWVQTSRREIPVSVEETEQGYRVDWAAFTQFHDAKFEKFLRDITSPGGEFYLQLRRSHYFGNDLADIDDWHAFRIQSPIAPYAEGFAFLRKSNPETKAILEQYRWSRGYRPYVELGWFTPEGGEPRIEIKRIVRPTWRR